MGSSRVFGLFSLSSCLVGNVDDDDDSVMDVVEAEVAGAVLEAVLLSLRAGSRAGKWSPGATSML